MGTDELIGDERAALTWLRRALADFYIHDWALLRNRVGERAMTARLGYHLTFHADRVWDVDAEYDRQGKDGALKVRNKATGKHMQPDLIVHRRGLRGAANNLLFVEVKRLWHTPAGDPNDIDKVRQAVIKHEYQVAVALGMRTAGRTFSPTWTAYVPSPGSQRGTCPEAAPVAQAEAVFDEAELVALEVSARHAERVRDLRDGNQP